MNKTVLILSSVWVEPKSSAAGTRMLQIIKLLQSQGYIIHYAATASYSEFSFDLASIDVQTHTIELNNSSFDVFVKQINPQIVIFDRFMIEEQFGWRVLNQCPDAVRILDTEDLHCLRIARQLAYKQNKEFTTTDLYSEHAKREIASILRCDLSLIISKFEMELLQSTFNIPVQNLFYLPFLTQLETTDFSSNPSFNERTDLVCIGNFLHEPNWATVQIIKEKIWPELRKKLPGAKMQIYGAYPSQKVLQLHKPSENFYVNGRADHAYTVIKNAKILLAPIPFGAGIKGKLYEAMLLGTPTVTTPIGAEAMHDNLNWNGFITNNYQEMIVHCTTLYQDEVCWQNAQNNGYELIKNLYDEKQFKHLFLDKLQTIKNNLTLHRNSNFIGEILNFHLNRSTEFMSRWIEEKNKK
jgi:O-antigen biosynthesis protein